ncbi:RNA polymerase sigma-70 factor [Pedobacter hiemivivus]|uniref:RNA polymerase sigma-70 factor n=1 Tax=Pedobacter hiemivivus TaxID=2530454 RepID=A0A4U1GJ99_9SPHI|nr:RNA polymerase sigma-70 factor [Pedobacter hiemivivus]TKC63984.1 RNA polymerase sigma-70 factor [Pedobacter hiemivivus]
MAVYSNLSEQELSTLLKEGDKYAYTEVYNRYWRKMFVVAHKRLGDQQDAEEIVQDIFVNLWRKRETFVLTTSFQNYFAVAVKFEILDVMRKRAHAAAYEKELGLSYTEEDISTLRELDLYELQERLQLTINLLPEKCQLVFRLKHDKGYSQKHIAEELDISEKTVEAHLSKARKTLKNKFGNLLGTVLFIHF